jgi:hypothetical protein
MTRRLALASALLALAVPAAWAAATPAQLAVRVAKSSFNGNQGSQWDTLHPKYRAVVTRARFVACERKAAAAIGKIKVLDVSAEGTQVVHTKLPLLGTVDVNDVTLAITYRKGAKGSSRIAELDSLWVAHKGHWVRIYTPGEYASYKAGKCP